MEKYLMLVIGVAALMAMYGLGYSQAWKRWVRFTKSKGHDYENEID